MACTVDCLMSMGKVSTAVKLLSANAKGGILSLHSQIPCGMDKDGCPLTRSMKDVLIEKHPPARVAVPESLLSSDTTDESLYNPNLFERSD